MNRKMAMFGFVKDGIILIIGALLLMFFNSIGAFNANKLSIITLIGIIIFIILAIYYLKVFCALGASLLYDNNYEMNKEKYTYRVSFLNEDKKSGFLFSINLMFHSLIGGLLSPIALLYVLINIKEFLNISNTSILKNYENETNIEMEKFILDEENNPKIHTKNKKWKLEGNSVLEYYYFNTEKEAYDFMIKNKIKNLPNKIF